MRTIDELERLKTAVEEPSLPKATIEWGGADVVITSQAPEPEAGGFYSEPLYVVTPHALELSWLFEQLRDAFYAEDRLDSFTKLAFFEGLARAANARLEKEPDATAHALSAAVLAEAFSIYSEMESGD